MNFSAAGVLGLKLGRSKWGYTVGKPFEDSSTKVKGLMISQGYYRKEKAL